MFWKFLKRTWRLLLALFDSDLPRSRSQAPQHRLPGAAKETFAGVRKAIRGSGLNEEGSEPPARSCWAVPEHPRLCCLQQLAQGRDFPWQAGRGCGQAACDRTCLRSCGSSRHSLFLAVSFQRAHTFKKKKKKQEHLASWRGSGFKC